MRNDFNTRPHPCAVRHDPVRWKHARAVPASESADVAQYALQPALPKARIN